MSRVAINIVTWNSQDYIERCLDAVLKQSYQDMTVTILDNCSSDGTVPAIAPYLPKGINLIQNSSNKGFAAAHNLLIKATDSEYVLVLNPDVYLRSDFVAQLIQAIEISSAYGAACGQLRAASREQLLSGEFETAHPPRIDEAGMGILRSRRQYPRGYQQRAEKRYLQPELVFGVCGAAAFYRRSMLEDICVNGEYFDEAFFIHKEDVDLAWRAQLLGWKSYYTPCAIGYHVRTFHPGQRKSMPSEIRRHAVKNRWLMAVKNERVETLLPDLPRIFLYELQIFAYLLLFERDSLPAYVDFVKLLPHALRWRRILQRRVQTSGSSIRHWFRETAE